MEPFNIYILGCGSAIPNRRHNTSAQVVELRGKQFLVDCGEGTQMWLQRSHVKFNRLQAVFISHLHGDHCFGLIGMISTFGLLGRTASLSVYAPAELQPLLDAQLALFCRGLEFSIDFHAVDTTKHQIIYEDRSLTVESLPLEHRMPCCGFIFREKPTLPHIRRDMIDFYHIPLSQINNIKAGADWITEDGEMVENSRLVTSADSPRSYAYCSDTRYMAGLHERLKGVTALYHESTYADDMIAMAEKYFHSTARQAATVARDAGVDRLILGHYSSRYEDESVLLDEAQQVFPNAQLSKEGMVIEL